MGLEDREAALRAEIERKAKELEGLPDFEELTDGTVAALFVTLGRSRPYTYVAYRARGLWYLTGSRSPNGVSSDALAEWLSTSGRRLVSAAVLGPLASNEYAEYVDLGALLGALTEDAPEMGYGSGFHPWDG